MMSPRTLASSQTSYFDEDQQGLGVQARLEGSSSQGADGGFAFDVQAGYSLPPEPKLRKSLSVLDQEHGPVIAEDDSFHIEEDGSLVLREVSLGISSEHAGIDKAVTISGQPDDYDFGLDLSTDPPEQQVSIFCTNIGKIADYSSNLRGKLSKTTTTFLVETKKLLLSEIRLYTQLELLTRHHRRLHKTSKKQMIVTLRKLHPNSELSQPGPYPSINQQKCRTAPLAYGMINTFRSWTKHELKMQ